MLIRRLCLALLPILLLSGSAEAATISLAGADCGTDPLLGLTFVMTPTGVSGGTTACPGVAVGRILDPSGTTPLYGFAITSVTFAITMPEQISIDNPLIVNGQLGADLEFFDVANGFTLTGGSIEIRCDSADFDGCTPQDITVSIEGFDDGTSFQVIAVNGATVPEPGTMGLLIAGLAAMAVRRRVTSRGRL